MYESHLMMLGRISSFCNYSMTPGAVVLTTGAALGEAAHASIAVGLIVPPVASVLLRSRMARGSGLTRKSRVASRG